MDYQESEKMDKFVGRLQAAIDLIEELNPEPPIPWKKSQLKLWGKLDEVTDDIVTGLAWDPKYMDDKEAIEF